MPNILPGDVLLYRPGKGFFSWLIRIKTWHPISHVEVAVSDRTSVASRDGVGVGMYAHRSKGLAYILRPKNFDLEPAMEWFQSVDGLPYGWLDLAQFSGLPIDGEGMVCSPFATMFLRTGGVKIFNNEPAIKIAPFQFLLSEALTEVWSDAKR